MTNAPNVKENIRVVVATVGATLRDESVVKKANVGGVVSEGMLCDSPMLNWQGIGYILFIIYQNNFFLL